MISDRHRARWHIVPALVFMAGAGLAGGESDDPVVVLEAGTILDGKGGVIRDASVVVEGSTIVGVGSRGPDGAVRYDLGELTLMPGWVDTHVHIGTHFEPNDRFHGLRSEIDESGAEYVLHGARNAYLDLMAGFTTIQSLGTLPGRAVLDRELRDWIAAGNPGPRILLCIGMIDDKTGTPEEIRAFVRDSVAAGADVIKLFATRSIRDGGTQLMSDEQIDAACDEARVQGRRSVVHAHGAAGARAAVVAGCTTIEHGTRLTDEVLDLMASRGTYFDPQFYLLEYYLAHQEKFLGVDNYTEEGFAYMREGLKLGLDTFRRALARNVEVVFGSDAVAGVHGRNYEELIYRVRKGGQSPMDAIVSATSLAAESLDLQDRVGAIALGLEADIIATAGNPLDDISAVRNVVFVMKGGQVYKNLRPEPVMARP